MPMSAGSMRSYCRGEMDRIQHDDKQTPTYAVEQSRSAILARSSYRDHTMIENVQQEVEWARAVRKITETAREMAEGRHVILTEMKWHRGHEAADSDNWWLTLTSDKRGVTERFPNDWLNAVCTGANDPRVAERLSRMVQELAGASESK